MIRLTHFFIKPKYDEALRFIDKIENYRPNRWLLANRQKIYLKQGKVDLELSKIGANDVWSIPNKILFVSFAALQFKLTLTIKRWKFADCRKDKTQ